VLKNQSKEKNNKDFGIIILMKLLVLLVIGVILLQNYVYAFEMDVGSSATISGPSVQPGPGSSGGGGGGGGRRNRELQVNDTIPPIINETIALDFRIKDTFQIIPKNKVFIQLIFNDTTKKFSKIIALDNNYVGYYIERVGIYRISEVPVYVNIDGFNLNISYANFMYISLVEKVPDIEKPAIIEKYVYNTLGMFILFLLIILIAFYVYYEAKKHKFLR